MALQMNLEALNGFPKFQDPNCADIDNKDLFFPESQLQLEKRLPRLLELCGSCKHQIECRDYAIKNEIRDGIWGGSTPNQRKAFLVRNRKEENRNHTLREIQQWLSIGFTKEQVAKKLGIQVPSLERRLNRAKQKGLL